MATRSNIHFVQDSKIIANVYVHYDGYPENRIQELQEFFLEVKSKVNDTRFKDPSYLAAKFIVWYTQIRDTRAIVNETASLDFLGIGITNQDAGDSDYIYTVDSSKKDFIGFPVVTYRKVW
jgi:hypothetical protein